MDNCQDDCLFRLHASQKVANVWISDRETDMTIEFTSDNEIVKALQAALSVIDAAIINGDDSEDAAKAYDLLQAALARTAEIEAAFK